MNQPLEALTFQAAQVAANALHSIQLIRPMLGPIGEEVRQFEDVIRSLRMVYGLRPKSTLSPRLAGLPKVVKPRTTKKPPRRLEDVESVELSPSAWDPEPVYEASRCKAFLMEIIRRAASDWVQYRQARKMELRALAEQAFTWLFEEEPGHPAWKDRERALFKIEDEDTKRPMIEVGTRRITSFLAICEACNLDPEVVRARAREMTVEQATRTGRRIERRNLKGNSDSISIESHSVVVDVDLDALDVEHEKSWSSGGHDYTDSRGYGGYGESAW